MRKFITYLLLLLSVGVYSQTNYYVSPRGSDSNLGTDSSSTGAFATWQTAINATTTPGDTVFFMGGTYYTLDGATIDKDLGQGANGIYGTPIVYMSYPGQWAVFDGSLHCSQDPVPQYNGFLDFDHAEHIHVKNMEIQHYFQCVYNNTGAISALRSRNLEFHNIRIHDISTPRGFYIMGGAWATHAADPDFDVEESYWGDIAAGGSIDTTRFINVDVYNMCDTLGGGNAADGWKGVWYGNNHVEWINCRAWNYSDDGWDPNNIDGATFVFENCWAMATQKYERFDVEASGFKLTPMYNNNNTYHPADYHYLKMTNCIAADNAKYTDNLAVARAIAFSDNFTIHVGGGVQTNTVYYNNVAYNNDIGFRHPVYDGTTSTSIYRNNISYQNLYLFGAQYTDEYANESHNNFDYTGSGYVETDTFTVDNWDFLSLDMNELTADRQSDGSLPDINFLKLRKGSDLIDAGTTPFAADDMTYSVDSAGTTAITPDVGVWEYEPYTGDTDLDILSFTFEEQCEETVYDYVNNTVTASVCYRYRDSVPILIPTVLPSDGDTISPGFQTVVDFTNPVTYTVSEIGGSRSETWTISIDTAEASTYANIRLFVLSDITLNNYIDSTTNTVYYYHAASADLSNLTPNIDLDAGATISPASGVPQDFTNDFQYTITAEDGVTQKTWTINMVVLAEKRSDGTLGYDVVFQTTIATDNRLVFPYISGEDATLNSISVYHYGEGGTVDLGIYNSIYNADASLSDHDPYELIAKVPLSSAVDATEGWQTFDLESSVNITANDTVWVSIQWSNKQALPRLYTTSKAQPYGGYANTYDLETIFTGFYTKAYYIYSIHIDYTTGTPTTARGKPARSSRGTYVKNGKLYILQY